MVNLPSLSVKTEVQENSVPDSEECEFGSRAVTDVGRIGVTVDSGIRDPVSHGSDGVIWMTVTKVLP